VAEAYVGAWWLDPQLALWVVDGLLILLLLEAVVLGWWLPRRTRGRLDTADVLWSLGGGLGLAAALRSAVAGWGLPAIALCMAVAGLCHVVDTRRRMRA
jgi:hypothetical protein